MNKNNLTVGITRYLPWLSEHCNGKERFSRDWKRESVMAGWILC